MKKLASLLFLLFLISCNNNDDNRDTSLDQSMLSGKIILPSNFEINTDQWTVNSPIDEKGVVNNEFQLDVFENSVSTILVTDGDKVKMMGYRISGEDNLEITSESTAKALIMCTPLLLSVDEQHRFSIINTAATFPEFTALKQAIENNLSTGNDLFDENNEAVFNALGYVIKKIHDSGNLRTAQNEQFIYDPVHFEHDKRKLTFWNNHIAYSTVIGIYKDGERIKDFEIKGVNAFPTSVSQLFSGVIGEGQTLLGDGKVSESYTLEGDGNFEVKIRTGLPLTENNTQEYGEALRANLFNACEIALKSFLPKIKNSNNTRQCIASLVNEIYQGVNGAQNLTAVSAINYAFKRTISSIESFYQCIYGEKPNLNLAYFGIQGKLYSVFEQYASKLNAIGSIYGNIANITFLATQWAIATPSVDICLVAEGDDVHTCCDGITVTDIDGNVYNVVTIGSQCWMQSNLNVSHYRNGDEIPQITSKEVWGSIDYAAWCYYEFNTANGPAYGKLYNQYAVNDPRGLAPEGYHIANNDDWNMFINTENKELGPLGGGLSFGDPDPFGPGSDGVGVWPPVTTVCEDCVWSFGGLNNSLITWSSTINCGSYNFYYANYNNTFNSLSAPDCNAILYYEYHKYKNYGYSVRCVQD